MFFRLNLCKLTTKIVKNLYYQLKVANYSPSKLEGVPEGRGRVRLSSKLGEVSRSDGGVCQPIYTRVHSRNGEREPYAARHRER